MTVAECSGACISSGYPLAGVVVGSLGLKSMSQITATARSSAQYSCYCGCSLNEAAVSLENATCSAPCTGAPAGDGPCGAAGAMATFEAECFPAPPANASKCASNGSHPLPPGPACSQPEAQKFQFCNVSLSLDDRVRDLVGRITVAEAGPLLTARESPSIPRLGNRTE